MAVASKRTQCAQIYGWFTEGFDAADLKDAKVLRDQSDWNKLRPSSDPPVYST
jgi:hypothetical protein